MLGPTLERQQGVGDVTEHARRRTACKGLPEETERADAAHRNALASALSL